MSGPEISLNDRFDISKTNVLLNGTQALVRLMLMQRARDRAAGLSTAGYVSGYRGSPLGAVDIQMQRAGRWLSEADVTFQPGLNEDLAATALWGTQQAELRGEGKYDGVFGLWYGKGPGVDRSGDVMRHANMAGTSPYGGVLMALGDDHTGESSTVCHQSDWALVDAYMPVLSPAGVQEILDFGMYGYALSRFAGVWVGLKTMKDTIEVTSIVDASLKRQKYMTPVFDMPEGGLNIRLIDHWIQQEERMVNYKRFAAEAFAHANKIDRRVWGKAGAKIGFVAAGKNWLDLVHALQLLGIDEDEALRLGITTYKVGQTWPLDMTGFHDWAEGLDLIVVVEEKRKLIEVQVKESIFDDRRGRRVYGWRKVGGPDGDELLFPVEGALNPTMIAEKIGQILVEEGRGTEEVKASLEELEDARLTSNVENLATRKPYFCAGCPHNTSTKLPDGSRAYAGIGCHIMATWMDRETIGYTHMGGEGANWVGEAPFSKTDHVFQNLGDGTYNHSGLMAIRAALAAETNITYKILYNDAVAMTGGQPNEGNLDAQRIAREVMAAGVEHVAVVHDPAEEVDLGAFPKGVTFHTRDVLDDVQKDYKKIKGVSVIIYVQTCAAEKRRRRKRGTYPDPDKRVFINHEVCEGCGDCGVQSNCVAVVPKETDFGRKRAIDQSTCNKDFSCLNGFCPSFVTLEGAEPKKPTPKDLEIPLMPAPNLPVMKGTYNIVVTGVGGTGVVTIGAILAQAAHIEGIGAGLMEMAGLAQKGGAVNIHCRLANRPEDISAIRVATGEADAVIGGDLVTTASPPTQALMRRGRTAAVVNTHEIITGEFTRDSEFRLPTGRMKVALEKRLGSMVAFMDAHEMAVTLLGDSIYSNMIMLGAAWQAGIIPVSRKSIRDAITLNGAAVEGNKLAFELGRWAAHDFGAVEALLPQHPEQTMTLDDRINTRVEHLQKYQSKSLARKFTKLVNSAPNDKLREAIAEGYHKVLTYKDEYEVARLLLQTEDMAREEFDGDFKMTYHLAPPIFSKPGPDGRPKKRTFGPWLIRVLRVLAKFKFLRGTPLDPFGYSAERKLERKLIREYETDIAKILIRHSIDTQAVEEAIARMPLRVLGFGPIKTANAEKAAEMREKLLTQFRAGGVGFSTAAE